MLFSSSAFSHRLGNSSHGPLPIPFELIKDTPIELESETYSASPGRVSLDSDVLVYLYEAPNLKDEDKEEEPKPGNPLSPGWEETDSMSSSSSSSSKKSVVSFGSVCVHTHPVTLGDNPAVSAGLPLALDWHPVRSELFCIDEFEKTRKGRSRKVTRLHESVREALLREMGCSTDSLIKVSREIEQIKRSRQEVTIEVSMDTLSPMELHCVMANTTIRAVRLADREAQREKRTEAPVQMKMRRVFAFRRWKKI
jgi:hypothetical protein